MYLDHFNLQHKPFSLTPDPAFLYLSTTHREALGHFLYGLTNRTGFIAVIGEVGTGKTTLLRSLLAQLPEHEYRTAFIFNPRVSSLELLRAIMREFELDVGRGGRDEMLNALNHYLLEQDNSGRTVVLVIDEAQNLGAAALEEVRLLSNLETETDKLLQIVLVGQPELAKTLEDRKLRQLRQRISVFYRLLPLSTKECLAYVCHRIEVAGGDPDRLFERSVLLKACRACGGIPRKLNVMLDRALLTAFTQEARQVTKVHLRMALKDLQAPLQIRSRRYWVWAGALLLLISLLPIYRSLRNVPPARDTQVLATSNPEQTIHPLVLQLSSQTSQSSRNVALNALLSLWNKTPIQSDTVAPMEQVVHAHQLKLYHFRGQLDEFLTLNSPALIPLRLPGVQGTRFIALLSVSQGRFQFAPELGSVHDLSREMLNSFWSGEALIPWADPVLVDSIISLGQQGTAVAEIQKRLLGAGFFAGVFDGQFDQDTLLAVQDFQRFAGLPVDGQVGPQTLIRLYQSGGLDSPAVLDREQVVL